MQENEGDDEKLTLNQKAKAKAKRFALITGITGQDGSYLAELLLEKGYQVHGLMRRVSNINTKRIDHIFHHPHLHVHYGDLLDITSLLDIMSQLKTETDNGADVIEVYNLGAQSHVKVSFETPVYTAQADAIGTLNLLESIRKMGSSFAKRVRLCQASTSEMFGASPPPQSETTPFYPRSPYGVSKLFAFWSVKNYREAYNLFACNAISFNHESERRGETFVTRKISKAVANYKRDVMDGAKDVFRGEKGGKEGGTKTRSVIELGNLQASRDWGHSIDYVKGMWMMLQMDVPDDYVIATGETHTVREFVEQAFAAIDVAISWRGEGVEEVGYRKDTSETLIKINPRYFRPTEVDVLLGDSTKLRSKTGWVPTISFTELVKRMVSNDIQNAS